MPLNGAVSTEIGNRESRPGVSVAIPARHFGDRPAAGAPHLARGIADREPCEGDDVFGEIEGLRERPVWGEEREIAHERAEPESLDQIRTLEILQSGVGANDPAVGDVAGHGISEMPLPASPCLSVRISA